MGHLNLYSKVYSWPFLVNDLMNKLTALGKGFTASQLAVLAGVPNECAPQLVNELNQRQLVEMRLVTGRVGHVIASRQLCIRTVSIRHNSILSCSQPHRWLVKKEAVVGIQTPCIKHLTVSELWV